MAEQKMVTTNLVRQRERGEIPWWRTTVVCDLPGLHNDDTLYMLGSLLSQLAAEGFEALLLRPTSPRLQDDLRGLPELVARAHEVGLKVIIRGFVLDEGDSLPAPGSTPVLVEPDDIAVVTERLREALESGVDGIDLGTISIPLGQDGALAESFSRAVQSALAEIALVNDSAILSAGLLSHPAEEFSYHLQEDWFHHLRSSNLLEVPWSAPDLREVVIRTYRAYDPLGHAVPWRHVLQRWSCSAVDQGSGDMGWAKSAPEARYQAMNLFVVSLPGAAYLPFLHTGGQIQFSGPSGTAMDLEYGRGEESASKALITRQALKLRKELQLATSPLAFVDGLPWANEDVLVSLVGHVMVVLNAGDTEVEVPEEHQFLLASDSEIKPTLSGTKVRPNGCAWFKTGSPIPLDPANYR